MYRKVSCVLTVDKSEMQCKYSSLMDWFKKELCQFSSILFDISFEQQWNDFMASVFVCKIDLIVNYKENAIWCGHLFFKNSIEFQKNTNFSINQRQTRKVSVLFIDTHTHYNRCYTSMAFQFPVKMIRFFLFLFVIQFEHRIAIGNNMNIRKRIWDIKEERNWKHQ